jgi:hypothetical protein
MKVIARITEVALKPSVYFTYSVILSAGLCGYSTNALIKIKLEQKNQENANQNQIKKDKLGPI